MTLGKACDLDRQDAPDGSAAWSSILYMFQQRYTMPILIVCLDAADPCLCCRTDFSTVSVYAPVDYRAASCLYACRDFGSDSGLYVYHLCSNAPFPYHHSHVDLSVLGDDHHCRTRDRNHSAATDIRHLDLEADERRSCDAIPVLHRNPHHNRHGRGPGPLRRRLRDIAKLHPSCSRIASWSERRIS